MAPFLSHLVIGEHVWVGLDGRGPHARGPHAPGAHEYGWHTTEHYGTFLFGCLAPDVDKFCAGLEQSTTHFLAKDRSYAWVGERTRRFLEDPARFLRAPYAALAPGEQALVLGYLCHIATDEATGRFAQRMHRYLQAAGETFPNGDAFLTVLDPRMWAIALNAQQVLAALEQATIPDGTFPFAPTVNLEAMRQVVLPHLRGGGGMASYMGMMRRHWQWRRHGRVSDAADDLDLERDLEAHRRRVEADLESCERLADELDVVSLAEDAIAHSRRCIECLITQEKGI